MGKERRRGARFQAEFWIAIPGLIDDAELRRGDVSISGIYFATSANIGELGQVHRVRVATADRTFSVELMGQLVRVIGCDDAWGGRSVAGVAFEFLFENDEQRSALCALVRAVSGRELLDQEGVKVDYQLEGKVEKDGDQEPQRVTVKNLGLDCLQMNTDWAPRLGEVIEVEIQAPASGRTFRVSGTVVAVTELAEIEEKPHFRVEVALGAKPQPTERAAEGGSIFEALDALLAEVTDWDSQPVTRPTRPDLRGEIDRVPPTSLIGFLHLERMTGRLQLQHEARSATIVVSNGRVLDAHSDGPAVSARALLQEIVGWPGGTFEFVAQDVPSDDRVGLPTTALLLDLTSS